MRWYEKCPQQSLHGYGYGYGYGYGSKADISG